jgi:hypothetical protein
MRYKSKSLSRRRASPQKPVNILVIFDPLTPQEMINSEKAWEPKILLSTDK